MDAATFEEMQAANRFSFFDALPRSVRDYLNEFPCGVPYDYIYFLASASGAEQTISILERYRNAGE